MNSVILYSAIAFMGGVAVPFLATINASFGQSIGHVYGASMVLCLVAFVSVLAVSLATGNGVPTLASFNQASWWHFLAGCFFMIYVVSITFVAPKIGVGNAIIFVVVAQIFTAVTIDHFGLLGAAVQTLDWKRALGIIFLIIGVALARSTSSSTEG